MKLILSLAFSLLLISPALAVPYTFTPLPDGFTATALNSVGQIAGLVPLSPCPGCPGGLLPALYDRGTITLLDLPTEGSFETIVNGINDAGQVVGSFALNPEPFVGPLDQGFLFDAGTFTTLNKPGAAATSPVAINNAGLIAGTYTDATGGPHGFTEAAGVFTEITGLDGAAFLPVDLNNLGQLIGTFGGTGPSYLAQPKEAVPEQVTVVLLSAGVVALGV